MVFTRIPIALGFLLILGSGGCAEHALNEKKPFVCTAGSCCKLYLKFHSDCSGFVDKAEVVLDDALEPEPLTYGTTFTSVGDIPNNSTGTYWVRSADIQWGPLQMDCPNSGTPVTLSCCSEDNQDACQ